MKSVLAFSSEFFHVVNDEQTPFAHASAEYRSAAVLVVFFPPPPHAATESTSATMAATPRAVRVIRISYIEAVAR